MLCVEFSPVQCIDLSKVVNVLKAVAIVTSEHLNLLTFLDSHLLNAKVSSEWRSNAGFGIQVKFPFPPNRGVPLIEVQLLHTYKDYVKMFPGPNLVSPD